MTFSVPHTGCQLRAVSEQVELRPVRCFIAEFLSFLRNECGNVYSCQCKFCFKTCPALNETDLNKKLRAVLSVYRGEKTRFPCYPMAAFGAVIFEIILVAHIFIF